MRASYLALVLSTLLVAGHAEARERLRVVGSPNGVGLIQPAAEGFADHWQMEVPGLEATGTALGISLFCKGVGFEHPDIVITSRPMTDNELKDCGANGVGAIAQIAIGRDAAVLASKAGMPILNISRAELFSALAAQVDRNGAPVSNPYTRWAQVRPGLPDLEILVMAPEPNTSASYAFQELAMAAGCKGHSAIMGLQPASRERACRGLRDDGHLVSAAKRESEVVGWLQTRPDAYAVTSYTSVLSSDGLIAAHSLDGVAPTPKTLASASYPLTTTLFLYVKSRHIKPIPGLQQFVYELTSERAIAPSGYLAEQGLIPVDELSRNHARDQALQLGL